MSIERKLPPVRRLELLNRSVEFGHRRWQGYADANDGVPDKYFLGRRMQPMVLHLVTSVQLVTSGR
jgi:hypothetical protein